MNKTVSLSIPTATDLLARDNTEEIKAMVHKIMRLTSGGRKLNQTQAVELAVYCFMVDANPFNFEAYYLPGVGPIPGVVLFRRKANEHLALSDPDDRFFVKFRDASPGEGDFDLDAGDIAQHATLRIRSVTERWQQNALRIFIQFIEAKMDPELAYKRAYEMNGPEPIWEAVATVDHRENFEGKKTDAKPEGTPDKWDKVERCKKRAEKWAIRKAFPTVILPDREFGDSSMVDPQVIDAVMRDIEDDPQPDRSEDEILGELGYDFEESDELPIKKMSLDTAKAIKNRDGEKYGDLPTDKLSHMYNSLVKSLKDPDVENREEKELKRDAIKVIMEDLNK